jgi:hypothetical protein
MPFWFGQARHRHGGPARAGVLAAEYARISSFSPRVPVIKADKSFGISRRRTSFDIPA